MIDIENEVFNRVANTLRGRFNGISVYGERVESPSSFPSVSIVEDDNSPAVGTTSLTADTEKAATLMYSVDIYSAKQSGKKAEAKDIREVIDTEMREMGFTRTYSNPTPNIDRTIYRFTLRYTRIMQTF